MEFECQCILGPEDGVEPCCPIHGMPMKLGPLDDDDIAWAYAELSKHGKLEGTDDDL